MLAAPYAPATLPELMHLKKFKLKMPKKKTWNKIGKGVQKGLGTATKIAEKAAPIVALAGPEYAQYYNQGLDYLRPANEMVQSFDLMQLNGRFYEIPSHELMELGFWNDFGKGFQQGFGLAQQAAGAAAPLVGAFGDAESQAAYNAAMGLTGQMNGFVQNQKFDLLNLDDATFNGVRLQNLDFWGDFAKGFQQGFDLAQQAAVQARPLVDAFGGQEYGQIYGDALGFTDFINQGVQTIY